MCGMGYVSMLSLFGFFRYLNIYLKNSLKTCTEHPRELCGTKLKMKVQLIVKGPSIPEVPRWDKILQCKCCTWWSSHILCVNVIDRVLGALGCSRPEAQVGKSHWDLWPPNWSPSFYGGRSASTFILSWFLRTDWKVGRAGVNSSTS